jgi:hypothetical protein
MTIVREATTLLLQQTSLTRSLTKSHERSLLSMAKLKSASSRIRPPIWSRSRIAQISFNFRGAFWPTSFPLFHGALRVAT